MSTLVRSKLSAVALAVGVLAVVMLIGTFFVRPIEIRAWVFTAAFGVALVAIALAAGDNLHLRHERVALLPTTKMGWWAVGLILAAFALLVGVSIALGALRSAGPGGPDALPVPLFAITGPAFLAMVAGGVVGLVAWFTGKERSWLVLGTVLPALFALYFVVGEFTFPH